MQQGEWIYCWVCPCVCLRVPLGCARRAVSREEASPMSRSRLTLLTLLTLYWSVKNVVVEQAGRQINIMQQQHLIFILLLRLEDVTLEWLQRWEPSLNLSCNQLRQVWINTVLTPLLKPEEKTGDVCLVCLLNFNQYILRRINNIIWVKSIPEIYTLKILNIACAQH